MQVFGMLLAGLVFAATPLNPTALQYNQSLQVPCAVNGDSGTCALDTGSTVALTMNPLQAKIARVTCSQQVKVEGVTGVGAGCLGTTSLTMGGITVTVPVEIDDSYTWVPLVGVPALEEVWPQGFTVEWQAAEIVPVEGRVQR